MSFLAAVSKFSKTGVARRFLHASSRRAEITKFQMPAMSPTMTEGGIAQWKKKEGEGFSAGDLLLEIETDKATIDVEAQEDGIMGKIIKQDGTKNIPVGTVIALLAQEGDDISNLEIPEEEPAPPSPTQSTSPEPSSEKSPPSPSTQPSPSAVETEIPHDRPLFPSVLRLLQENHVKDVSSITGTGIRGMLTKGDVLAFLGKASSPLGTYKDTTLTPSDYKAQAKRASAPGVTPPKAPLDAAGIRRTIIASFLADSIKSRTPAPSPVLPTVDSIIDDYLPQYKQNVAVSPVAVIVPPPKTDYLDDLH